MRAAFASRMFPAVRSFSSASGSDKDFEPKRIVPPTFDEIKVKLEELVKNNKVVLFMKGSPSAPQCGFSRQVVQVLTEEGLGDYIYVDVLKSEAIRDAVKKFSDWRPVRGRLRHHQGDAQGRGAQGPPRRVRSRTQVRVTAFASHRNLDRKKIFSHKERCDSPTACCSRLSA